jgi:hypothetical protein
MSPHVQRLADRFPAIPAAVLLKIDLLRRGMRVDSPVGSRHYHHHDEQGQKALPDARAHLQGSIRLPEGLQVFVAHNPVSPYVLGSDGQGLLLSVERDGVLEPICRAEPGPTRGWTSARTSRGTPMATVFSPSLGGACGPIAAFLLRHCEFAVSGDECRFCSWVRMGKSIEMRPDVDDMRETLRAIRAEQGGAGYLAFSGGSLRNRTREADAFIAYMDAVRDTGEALPPTVAAIQALDEPDSRRLLDAGFDYACYSMEVWDEDVWPAVLPGKSHSLGRGRWMSCLDTAVDVFGPGRVLCNFVAGVETAVPGAYASPEAAADATLEGMRWCYEHGVYPKYAVWIVSGGARFADREPAPLEYYARLVTGRQALFEEFEMPVPHTDCVGCLTQSVEADMALLDPARYARGAAAYPWRTAHEH